MHSVTEWPMGSLEYCRAVQTLDFSSAGQPDHQRRISQSADLDGATRYIWGSTSPAINRHSCRAHRVSTTTHNICPRPLAFALGKQRVQSLRHRATVCPIQQGKPGSTPESDAGRWVIWIPHTVLSGTRRRVPTVASATLGYVGVFGYNC
jgi:hypothetical protein